MHRTPKNSCRARQKMSSDMEDLKIGAMKLIMIPDHFYTCIVLFLACSLQLVYFRNGSLGGCQLGFPETYGNPRWEFFEKKSRFGTWEVKKNGLGSEIPKSFGCIFILFTKKKLWRWKCN